MRTGGVSPNAYLFGSEFTREATREFQQRRLDEAVDFLEAEIQRSSALAGGSAAPGEAESIRLRTEGQQKLVSRLRQTKASGRIVLELRGDNVTLKDLPEISLEDGDRLLVPARPSTVSVIGSVYNQNAFLYKADSRVSDYLARAGGPTRNADADAIFVIRADGTVISRRQSGFLGLGGLTGEQLTPGDAIVVPEDLEKFRFTKELKDWTQIFSQFALGVTSLAVLKGL
jgi:protein involved in polysaccharide export with SLBB domain